MRVRGIDHIVLVCADVESTVSWWRSELGLAPLRLAEWRAGTVPFPSVRINDATIVDFVAGVRTGTNLAHVALEVDVDAARLEQLAAERGWDVAVPLDPRLFGARGLGAGIYIRDPDGTVVELRTYADAATDTGS